MEIEARPAGSPALIFNSTRCYDWRGEKKGKRRAWSRDKQLILSKGVKVELRVRVCHRKADVSNKAESSVCFLCLLGWNLTDQSSIKNKLPKAHNMQLLLVFLLRVTWQWDKGGNVSLWLTQMHRPGSWSVTQQIRKNQISYKIILSGQMHWRWVSPKIAFKTKRKSTEASSYRVISRGVLHAAIICWALIIFVHEDRRFIGGEESRWPVQVLVEVVLPLTGCLRN